MSENLKFDKETNTLTVNDVEGVEYRVGSKVLSGEVKLNKTTTVKAYPVRGRVFPHGVEREWTFEVDSSEKSSDEKPTEVNDPSVPAATAGSTPESTGQQASKADAAARVSGANPRQP